MPTSSFLMAGSFLSKKRHKISLRLPTKTAQKEPEDKRSAVMLFHRNIRQKASEGEQVGPLGQWNLHQIAYMDQNPLPFSFIIRIRIIVLKTTLQMIQKILSQIPMNFYF